MSVEIESLWKYEAIGSNLLNGLIAYWKLDESSGDAIDSHNSYDGTVQVEVTRSQIGILNNCYFFGRSNSQYINFGKSSVFQTQEMTISAWVVTAYTSDYQTVAANYQTNNGWQLLTETATGRVHFGIRSTINGSIGSTGTTNIADDDWHHLVGVFDGAFTRIYVDGVEEDYDPSGNYELTYNEYNNMLIGVRTIEGIGSTIPFGGLIDEVAIWNRGLTPTEISLLFNSGSAIAYPFS